MIGVLSDACRLCLSASRGFGDVSIARRFVSAACHEYPPLAHALLAAAFPITAFSSSLLFH
jgi:hypothetical protein